MPTGKIRFCFKGKQGGYIVYVYVQEVFHVYLNKFEIAKSLSYLVIIHLHWLI